MEIMGHWGINIDKGATITMSMTESLVYLFLATAVGFAVILALYLLHRKMDHQNEMKLKTKAEK